MSTNVPFDLNAAADLTDLSIQDIWLKSPADLTEYHKDIYYVDPVDDYIVKDSSVTAVKSFSKIAENGQIPAGSPHQGFDKTYTQSFFSGMLRITRPMWRYGIKARKLESLVKELKNDAMRFREQVLANTVNNMSSTSYSDTTGQLSFTVTNTGGDGDAPNSTSHTREDGGTDWNNQITDGTTVNMDFDYDAWKAALKTAQAIKGGVGEILDISLDKLLCKKNSSVHHRAMEVLNTMKKGDQPNTANREGSVDDVFSISANPYLTSDLQYGVFDSSMIGPKFGFQLKQGMDLQLDPQFIDYDTKEIKYSSGMDFAYGFNDLRNFLFSDGTNA